MRDSSQRDVSSRDFSPRDSVQRDSVQRNIGQRDSLSREAGPRDSGQREPVQREAALRDVAQQEASSRDVSANAPRSHQRYAFSSDAVRRCLRHGDISRAEKLIDKITLSQLSAFVRDLTPLEARALCDLLLAPTRVTRTLDELPRPELALLLGQLGDARLLQLLLHLNGAHVARVMALLPPERRSTIRKQQQARAESFTNQIRPVSSVMATSVPTLLSTLTAGEARAQVDIAAPFEQVYLVDGEQQLVGVLSREQLLAAAPEVPLSQLLEAPKQAQAQTFTARAFTPLHVALRQMQRHALRALPVLDSKGRLLGEVRVGAETAATSSPSDAPRADVVGWKRLVSWLGSTLMVVGITNLGRALTRL